MIYLWLARLSSINYKLSTINFNLRSRLSFTLDEPFVGADLF